MNAKDFRIGNLINYKMVDKFDERKEWLEISEIDYDDLRIFGIKNEMNQDYQLIPLTEDWLGKFGFVKIDHHRFKIQPSQFGWYYTYSIHDNAFRMYVEDSVLCLNTIFNVHEIQNLYFTLTGAELVVS